MTAPEQPPFLVAHLDELEQVPLETGSWRPIRRTLGVTAFGVNAYTAARAGDGVIEPHDETTVLVVGGRPGAGLPPSPFEYWYAAVPAYAARDYERAYEIAAEGLRDHPDHGTLHYQLACYRALAGRHDEAVEHLRIAFANDPRTREWAITDTDLDAVRDDPLIPPRNE